MVLVLRDIREREPTLRDSGARGTIYHTGAFAFPNGDGFMGSGFRCSFILIGRICENRERIVSGEEALSASPRRKLGLFFCCVHSFDAFLMKRAVALVYRECGRKVKAFPSARTITLAYTVVPHFSWRRKMQVEKRYRFRSARRDKGKSISL